MIGKLLFTPFLTLSLSTDSFRLEEDALISEMWQLNTSTLINGDKSSFPSEMQAERSLIFATPHFLTSFCAAKHLMNNMMQLAMRIQSGFYHLFESKLMDNRFVRFSSFKTISQNTAEWLISERVTACSEQYFLSNPFYLRHGR